MPHPNTELMTAGCLNREKEAAQKQLEPPPLDTDRKWSFDTPEADYGREAEGDMEDVLREPEHEDHSGEEEEDAVRMVQLVLLPLFHTLNHASVGFRTPDLQSQNCWQGCGKLGGGDI